jgi:7-cyano-7-deazaguanine synthase
MFLSGRPKIPVRHITNKKKAVILLSGGLDSATVFYQAKAEGYDLYALSFNYGQRHKKELVCAKKLVLYNKTKWQVLKIALPWKGSALIDKNIKISQPRLNENKIPNTYVPSRNIIFLSYAASYAESIKASKIFIGVNQIDYSGYPDCREAFLNAFSSAIGKGTRTGSCGKNIDIEAPLINMTKKDIIIKALELGVPFHYTWSCYKGLKFPCQRCESCIIRKQGFHAAGIKDTLSRP